MFGPVRLQRHRRISPLLGKVATSVMLGAVLYWQLVSGFSAKAEIVEQRRLARSVPAQLYHFVTSDLYVARAACPDDPGATGKPTQSVYDKPMQHVFLRASDRQSAAQFFSERMGGCRYMLIGEVQGFGYTQLLSNGSRTNM